MLSIFKKQKPEYHITSTGVTWFDKSAKKIRTVSAQDDFDAYVEAIEMLSRGDIPSDALQTSSIDILTGPAPIVVVQNKALNSKWVSAASMGLNDGQRIRMAMKNFASRISQNPSNRSRDQLLSFMDHNDIPLMESGHLLAFKRVTPHMFDLYSGKTNEYQVGTTHAMDRSSIDDDPASPCGVGLHAGGYDYVSWFGSSNNPIIAVKIDPADVVCVPNDSSHGKIRCCKLDVTAVFESLDEMKKASKHLLAVFIEKEGVQLSDMIRLVGAITGKKGNISVNERQAVVDYYIGEVNEVLFESDPLYREVIALCREQFSGKGEID